MRFHPLGPGQKGVAQRGGRSVSAAGGWRGWGASFLAGGTLSSLGIAMGGAAAGAGGGWRCTQAIGKGHSGPPRWRKFGFGLQASI